MIKENDMILNLMANEDFTVSDFQAVGLNAGNTSLRSEDEYKRSDKIKNHEKFQTDGKFDESKFHDYYIAAAQFYNQLSTTDYDKTVMDMAQYNMDNIWVDSHKRTKDMTPKLSTAVNENLVTSSLDAVGKKGQRTLSQREIAQTQKVYNTKTGEWEESPNDSWWGHLTDTLVLATYDEDEYDDNGNLIHRKGERKLNDEGLPYYETLGGRNVYGKQVLNKLDTLTKDGSKLNRFDFFDADDIEQKNLVGTIMRNAALVGSMFIGGPVGPVVRGLSVATQAAGLLASMGKVVAGNDNKLLNNVQGWAKTVNRQSQTDYAAQHTWCMENILNMIGDTAGQLAEQRFLFEYVPAAIKGSGREGWKVMAGGSKGQNEIINKKAGEYLKDSKKISDFLTANKARYDELDKFNTALQATATKVGQRYVDDIIKSHQKIGEVISKAYMTGLTVQDTYGEARAAGASHLEAALLTLGYAGAEIKLLNSELGSWIMPELHGEKFRNQAIFEGLTKLRQTAAPAVAAGGEAAKQAKRTYVQTLIDLGKDFFNGNIAKQAMESGTAKGLKVLTAHSLGEAFEETSEEFLADFSKSVLNVVRWIRGEEGLDMGQWDNMLDRYGMSALGGFLGGGINSAATDFSVAKKLSNMNQTEAMQELLYIVNNDKEEEFLKDIEKMQINDKNLSAFEPITVDGETVAWAEAKEGEDQDTIAKKLVRKQINTLKSILTSERAKLSTDSLLSKLAGSDAGDIVSDVLYGRLRESQSLKLFAQDFQLMQDNLVKAKAELMAAEYKPTDSSEIDEERVTSAKEMLKLRQEEIRRYLDGSIVPQAIRNAAYEINSSLHGGFDLHLDKNSFAKYKTGLNYEDLSEKEKKEIDDAHQLYLDTQASDDINIASQAFYDMLETATPIAQAYGERLKLEKQKSIESQKPIQLVDAVLNELSLTKEQLAEREGLDSIDQDQYLEHITKNLQLLSDGMFQQIGLLTEDIIQQKLQIESNFEEGNKDNEKKASQHSVVFLNDAIFDRLDGYLKPLLDAEYLHPELKNSLLQMLNNYRKNTKFLSNALSGDPSNPNPYYHPNLEGINPFTEPVVRGKLVKTYHDRIKVIDQYIQKVNDIANTPVLELLDQFKSASINSEVKVSQHIQKTQELLESSLNELDDFTQQEDWEKINDEAIRVVDSFIAVMEGMKTDNSDFDNPTGYTPLINAISKKYKIKDYVPLAELDSEIANLIIQDAITLKNKLVFARNLSDSNKGQKLKQQDRVAGRKNIILYKNYQRLVNIIPDDWVSDEDGISAKQKLSAALNNLDNLKSFVENDVIKLNKEQKYQSAKELQTFEDILYDVFRANQKSDGTFDEDKLSKLLIELAGTGGFFQKTGDLLLEDSADIDMNSFIWHLAVRTSLKTSDYLAAYKKGLTPDIAAIPSQELAVQFGVAALSNMAGINQWTKSYRKAITTLFNKLEEKDKKEALKRFSGSNNDPFATTLSKYFISHDSVPQFLNMLFFEGGPGTGKSGGIFKMIVNIAKNIDSNFLSKSMFIHATDQSAKDSGNALGINLTKGREQFLSWISSEWKDVRKNRDKNGNLYLYEDSYTFNETGQLINKWKLNEYSEDELPKFIFIDEVSHYSQQELSMIEQFARKNGIVVFTAGDLDQDKLVVYIKDPVTKKDISVSINRNFFPRIPKLGVSLRTRNRQMTYNTAMLQAKITQFRQGKQDLNNIKFTYLDDDPKHKGLYGVKSYDREDGLTDEVKKTIQLMIDTLKPEQKIGLMYYSKDSELYKYLMDNFKDKINPFLDSNAQGLEGQYYIIDVDPNLDPESYLSRLYTGVTRAEQGVLAFVDRGEGTKYSKGIDSIKDPIYFEENLSEQAVLTSSKNREEEITRQLQGVETNPVTINYISKETLDIKEFKEEEEDDLGIPDVAEEVIIPEKMGEGYTNKNTAQSVIDEFLNTLGTDLDKLTAIDNTDPDDPQEFDITSVELKESEQDGTPVWTPTITLKDSEGNLAENSLEQFLKDFKIVNKDSEEVLPLYKVGDKITIKTKGVIKNIEIESINTSDDNVIYNIKDLEDDSTDTISQNDLQSNFVEYYNPVSEETSDSREEVVIDDGRSNYSDEEMEVSLDYLNRDEIDDTVEGENLTQFLYTHNIHETGGINNRGYFRYSKTGTKRIDNGNGLVKIFGRPLLYTEVQEILGEIRGKVYHESNDELAKYFKDLIGKEIEVDWAFKSSSEDNNRRDSNYDRFAVNEHDDETLDYIHVDEGFEDKAKKPMRKKLMLRVKDKSTGKFILEVSVASLNSPLTILQKQQDGIHIYDDFYKTYMANNTNEDGTPNAYKGIKAVVDKYYEHKDRFPKHAQDLLELCKFWMFTSDGIFPLSSGFNLASQNGTGPIYTMQKGNNQLNEELQSTSKLINLEEFAENKTLHISSVMVSKDGKVGGIVDKNIHSGLAFVLVSDNPKFNTDDALERQYSKQVREEKEGKSVKQEVRLKYITSPKTGVREWMHNQNALYRRAMGYSDETYDIGDKFTVFRILQAIQKAGHSLKDLNSSYGSHKIIEKYINKLNEIEQKWSQSDLVFSNIIEETTYKELLSKIGEKRARRRMKLDQQLSYLNSEVDLKNDKVVTGGKAESPGTTVHDRLISFLTKAVWRTPVGATEAEFNKENLDNVVNWSNEGDFKDVRFQLRLLDESQDVGSFIRVKTGTKYSLGNIKIGDTVIDTNFKINSRIDTSVFSSEQMSKEIADFNTRWEYKKGAYQFKYEYYNKHMKPYVEIASSTKTVKNPSGEESIKKEEKTLGDQVKSKYSTYTPYLDNDILNSDSFTTETEMLLALAKKYSETPGQLGVVYNGMLFLSEFKDVNGNPIKIINFDNNISSKDISVKVNRNGEVLRGVLTPEISRSGTISGLTLQLYELESISTETSEFIFEDSYFETLQEIYSDTRIAMFLSRPKIYFSDGNLNKDLLIESCKPETASRLIRALQMTIDSIKDYEPLNSQKNVLIDLINKLESINNSEIGNNLQIGDTVRYNNKYYTITATGDTLTLENEETKELESVSNIEDVKKEIIDCNPVNLKMKPSFIGI